MRFVFAYVVAVIYKLLNKKNMFVLSRHVDSAYRVIATLLAVAMLLFAVGTHSIVKAADVSDASDLLTDSAPSAASNHTVTFTTPSGVVNTGSIQLTFPTVPDSFTIGAIDEDDMDVSVNGTDIDLSTWSVATTATTILFTVDTGSVAADAEVIIEIGTNAWFGASGTDQILNPATSNTSYEIDISAGADSGHVRVAIVDAVTVSASVNTTFDFTVYGNATSTVVNGTSTTRASQANAIPFGTLVANEIETLSQDLTVGTNARNGFVVTVHSDGQLESTTGGDIDNFDDSVIGNPAAWSAPANDVNDENTWGHWGITSEDTDTTRVTEFANNQWQGVTTTPTVIFSHTGPADETTPGIGSTTIGYQVEITALQEAGDDYSAVLTYIATPTF